MYFKFKHLQLQHLLYYINIFYNIILYTTTTSYIGIGKYSGTNVQQSRVLTFHEHTHLDPDVCTQHHNIKQNKNTNRPDTSVFQRWKDLV